MPANVAWAWSGQQILILVLRWFGKIPGSALYRARFSGRQTACAVLENVFNVFLESRKHLVGMGCKARCAVDSPAIHKRHNAADRPTRHLPEGLGRNRAIGRPSCLHGHEPMRRTRATHSSRLHSQRDLPKDIEHVLNPVADGIRVISFRKANQREVRNYESTRAPD